jgi:F-type H+-transporting ATPase subunit delta
MDQSRVSVSYAKALLGWATDAKLLSEVYAQSIDLLAIIDNNSDFVHFIHSPIVSLSKKNAIIIKVLDGTAPLLTDFIKLIAKNRREKFIKHTLLVFQRLYREKQGIIKCQVESAGEIGVETQKAIEAYLASNFNKSVQMEFYVKPSLIGGFVVTIEDKLLDKSIKWELEKLRRKLTGIEY